jgi:arginase
VAQDPALSAPFDLMLGVPIDCSGAFVGCQRLPAALRAAGIAEALGVPDGGNLQVAIADPVRDPGSGVIGLRDVVGAATVVREALAPLLAERKRPLVLGGCCTLLIGVAAALRDIGADAGLLFVDGHLDCYDGASSLSGEAADMELAVLLGVGAEPLVRIAGEPPLLPDRRVAVLGPADEAEAARDGAPDPRRFAPAMPIVTSVELSRDPAGHARAALEHLRDAPAGFWLHLDLDVLSAAELPAVDYPQEQGLTWDELLALLRPVLADDRLLGADVTILNPTLDPDGSASTRTVRLLADALGP